MKMLLRLVVVLVLLLAAGLLAGFFYLNTLARVGIERGGSYALGVPTTVDSARVGLLSGTFSMGGLDVANPSGFERASFLTLGDADVAVSLGTLMKPMVELPRLHLNTVEMSLERRGQKANYAVILENLKRFESGEAPREDGKKFVIREVVMRDVLVHVDAVPVGGSLTKVDVPIDEIRLTDVGSDSDRGALLAEVTDILVKAIIAAVLQKGGDLIPPIVYGDLQQQLAQLQSLGDLGVGVLAGTTGQLEAVTAGIGGLGAGMQEAVGEQAGEAIKGVQEQAGEALKGVEEKAGEALKGLGGLLGGEKKKEEGEP